MIHLWACPQLAASAWDSPALGKIYRASLDSLRFRRDELRFVPMADRISLSPINGYVFPVPRPAPRMIERPRPPGKDVLDWLLESAD
jgi:hypothetical protein